MPSLRSRPAPAASCAPTDGSVSPPPERCFTPVALAVGGNRCGHVPSAPRFDVTPPEGANPARPALIGKAIAQLRRYYDSPRDGRWDELSQGERHARLERQIEAAGAGSDEGRRLARRLARWRQQRSERREALVGVVTLLLSYTDIATLTVAVPSGEGWLGLSAPWIGARAGLSASRVKRALATLTRCRLLAATGQGRRFDRRRRRFVGTGWGPVRRFSFRLIRALGLDVSWDQARRRQRKRARAADARPPAPSPAAPALAPATASPAASPAPAPPAPASPLEAGERVRALRRALASPAARQAETDPAARQARIERNRRTAELAAQGLSPADIRQRLNDAAQPP
ncbi:MAG: hypothetical protein IPP10_15235 [Candidatus Competibacteraceae bacterium]|nr:hypothetical protein [Candidatus Competibacteraceae bacterium]MBK9952802.1 hypothetical protein [Candidatus Competibacteraceae bacterium]